LSPSSPNALCRQTTPSTSARARRGGPPAPPRDQRRPRHRQDHKPAATRPPTPRA
jgi:hypothetical protein